MADSWATPVNLPRQSELFEVGFVWFWLLRLAALMLVLDAAKGGYFGRQRTTHTDRQITIAAG